MAPRRCTGPCSDPIKRLVDLLLRAGANAKAANREGSTPLWLASVNGDAAIIEALIKAGADANEKLPLGRTPLMEASRTGNVDAMKVLLDHGADLNAKETLRGTTPLMWAADEGHAPAIQLLIEHGADIKARRIRLSAEEARRSGNRTIREKRSRRRARLSLPESALDLGDSRLAAALCIAGGRVAWRRGAPAEARWLGRPGSERLRTGGSR